MDKNRVANRIVKTQLSRRDFRSGTVKMFSSPFMASIGVHMWSVLVSVRSFAAKPEGCFIERFVSAPEATCTQRCGSRRLKNMLKMHMSIE